MKKQFGQAALMVATVGTVVGAMSTPQVAAAGGAPVVTGGSMTVRYEDVYSINFTASDPEGDPLTVVVPPANEDWIGCDGGPVADFNCEYSSSRYYDPAPLPTSPFKRTISYSVSDGTSTSTGVWNITVLPPPTLEIVGHPTVTEGGEAVLQLRLSASTSGPYLALAHANALDAADGEVVSSTPFIVEVADGEVATEVRIPVPDDASIEPTEYFSVSVDAADAIPYRFVDGGNLVTVLDNDAPVSGDKVPPVVDAHRNLIVERGGDRTAFVPFSPPTASDDVDGKLQSVCTPGSMSAMPIGVTKVTCTATDAAGNTGTGSFQVTVRRPTSEGSAKALRGGHRERECIAPGQFAWVTAGGFTPGSQVRIELQSSALDVVTLQTVTADRKGRVRQLVQIPAATPGDSDILLSGAVGNDDFVRMLPLRVGKQHHRQGALLASLRNRDCDD